MSDRKEILWFKIYANLVGSESPKNLLGILFLAWGFFSVIWTLYEVAGGTGSLEILLYLIGSVSLTSLIFVMTTKILRWPLLYLAVQQYISLNLIGKLNTKDLILVSCASGGAVAVAMVAKTIQELGYPLPKTIVIDLEYSDNGIVVGSLLPNDFNLQGKNCLIVHSYLGTGRSMFAIKDRLKIYNAPVFCFVVSRPLISREKIDYYMYAGDRSVFPWPESLLNRRGS